MGVFALIKTLFCFGSTTAAKKCDKTFLIDPKKTHLDASTTNEHPVRPVKKSNPNVLPTQTAEDNYIKKIRNLDASTTIEHPMRPVKKSNPNVLPTQTAEDNYIKKIRALDASTTNEHPMRPVKKSNPNVLPTQTAEDNYIKKIRNLDASTTNEHQIRPVKKLNRNVLPTQTAEDNYIKKIQALDASTTNEHPVRPVKNSTPHFFPTPTAEDYIKEIQSLEIKQFDSLRSEFGEQICEYLQKNIHTLPTSSIRQFEEEVVRLRRRNKIAFHDGHGLEPFITQAPFQTSGRLDYPMKNRYLDKPLKIRNRR